MWRVRGLPGRPRKQWMLWKRVTHCHLKWCALVCQEAVRFTSRDLGTHGSRVLWIQGRCNHLSFLRVRNCFHQPLSVPALLVEEEKQGSIVPATDAWEPSLSGLGFSSRPAGCPGRTKGLYACCLCGSELYCSAKGLGGAASASMGVMGIRFSDNKIKGKSWIFLCQEEEEDQSQEDQTHAAESG